MQETDKLKAARRIIRKLCGWSAKDERDDKRDYPEIHEAYLKWVVRQIDHLLRAERDQAAREIESVIADWPYESHGHSPASDGAWLADYIRENGP